MYLHTYIYIHVYIHICIYIYIYIYIYIHIYTGTTEIKRTSSSETVSSPLISSLKPTNSTSSGAIPTPKLDPPVILTGAAPAPKLDPSVILTGAAPAPKLDPSVNPTGAAPAPKLDSPVYPTGAAPAPKLDSSVYPTGAIPAPKLDPSVNPTGAAPGHIGVSAVPIMKGPLVSAPFHTITRPLLKKAVGYQVNCSSKDIISSSTMNNVTQTDPDIRSDPDNLIPGTIRSVDLLRKKCYIKFDVVIESIQSSDIADTMSKDLEFDYESSLINWLKIPEDSLLTRSKVHFFNVYIHIYVYVYVYDRCLDCRYNILLDMK
jgi:hypothetical protein